MFNKSHNGMRAKWQPIFENLNAFISSLTSYGLITGLADFFNEWWYAAERFPRVTGRYGPLFSFWYQLTKTQPKANYFWILA